MGRKKTGKDLNCIKCNKSFYVSGSRLKKGVAKYCSQSCARTHKNETNNPAWREDVRKKISENHADVSGKNNPMYGRRGKDAPSYKHGFVGKGKRGEEKRMDTYKIIALTHLLQICEVCGNTKNLEVHHKDGNNKNHDLENLCWLCKTCHSKVAHTWERDANGRFTGAKTNPI